MCTSGVCATKSVLFGSSKQHRQHARGFHSSLLMQAGCSLGHSPPSDGDAIYKSLQLCCDWLDADVTQACHWLSSQRLPRNPFVNRLLLLGAQSPHHQGVWGDCLSYWWGIAILKWLIIQVIFAPPPYNLSFVFLLQLLVSSIPSGLSDSSAVNALFHMYL